MFLENSGYNANVYNSPQFNDVNSIGTKKVYILLTYTNTTFAKVTKYLLEQPYTHCSISLNKDLKELFSFNFSSNSFVMEDIWNNKVLMRSRYSLYSLTVTDEQYEEIKEFIYDMVENKERYKYNTIGLARLLLNKPKETEERYFCSQFAAKVLSIADNDIFNKHTSLVSPGDFAKNKKLKFETRGILGNYDDRKVSGN